MSTLLPEICEAMAVEQNEAAITSKEESQGIHRHRCRSAMDFDTQAALTSALMGTCSAITTEGCAVPIVIPSPTPETQECDWKITNLDKESFPQTLEEEMRRLTTLREYSILDSQREEQFERVTALTSRIFDVPIALVSLVDLGRQWFMSNRGLGSVRETPRNVAFCSHAILSKEDIFIVPDATADSRFKDNGLVTGAPDIRFYAGAPLLSPEGYKLGTLCIIDTKPWPNGLSFHEKQNLRELSAIAMDTLVNRKRELDRLSDEKTRLIACAAHDLLTPLTGLQLNLGLVIDDDKLATQLDDHQKELMMTAVSCSEIMGRICIQAIESFRGKFVDRNKNEVDDRGEMISTPGSTDKHGGEIQNVVEKGSVNINRLIKSIGQVIGPYPKKVPLSIEVDENVPEVVISDDLKLFRSTMNYLTNACKHTTTGSINLRIYVQKAVTSEADAPIDHRPGALTGPNRDVLVVECRDTGPGINLAKYSNLFKPMEDVEDSNPGVSHSKMTNSGLGLFSVANAISSLDGEYGAFLREDLVTTSKIENGSNHDSSIKLNGPDATGGVFWFSVPLVLPRMATCTRLDPPGQQSSVKCAYQEACGESKLAEPSLGLSSDANEDVTSSKPKERTNKRSYPASSKEEENEEESIRPAFKKPSFGSNAKLVDVSIEPRRKRVIVIDDSLTIRKGLARGFSRLGFEVDEAENGLQGLKKMKETAYELVILDFLMPVMDGLDVAKKYRSWEVIHRAWFHQYIVGISAHANDNDAQLGIKSGMDRFMGKPVPLKSLKDMANCRSVKDASLTLDRKFQEALEKENDEEEKSAATGNDPSDTSCCSLSLSDHALRRYCLIAENSKPMIESLQFKIERRGWRAVAVHSGDDALRLLKMRNWDTVLIDDDLPHFSGSSCLARFREWETRSRVVRQKNIYTISSHCSPHTKVILSDGFDGALGKPLDNTKLYQILDNASKESFKCDREILLR